MTNYKQKTQRGSIITHEGVDYRVESFLPDSEMLVGTNLSDASPQLIPFTALVPVFQNGQVPQSDLPPEQQQEAIRRYQIISPILLNQGDGELVKQIAQQEGIGKTTLYRWVNIFRFTGVVGALLGKPKPGRKGQSSLDSRLNLLIDETIQKEYMTLQRKSMTKVLQAVQVRMQETGLLDEGIRPPSYLTIRNRIRRFAEYTIAQTRYGKKAAKNQWGPKMGEFPGGDFPLSDVQMDSTPLSIKVVDEQTRKPVNRSLTLTLAIDVYSRMVVGYYLSFSGSDAYSAGMCLANAILPKESLLAQFDFAPEFSWPCRGRMHRVMLDNAPEYRGRMVDSAGGGYGIEINWRPGYTPGWSGIVERFFKTLDNGEIHALEGTTFSNYVHKGQAYKSSQEAILTKTELEKYLLIFLVRIYSASFHEGIQDIPLRRYREGIYGTATKPGVGLAPLYSDPDKLRKDFMPYEERTIQPYGVDIDGIRYTHPVFTKWMAVGKQGKKPLLKHKFRRDPYDVSRVYFWDTDTKFYYTITCRDTTFPAMNIWDYRKLRRERLKVKKSVNLRDIIHAYQDQRKIREEARQQAVSKQSDTKLHRRHATKPNPLPLDNQPALSEKAAADSSTQSSNVPLQTYTPYPQFD